MGGLVRIESDIEVRALQNFVSQPLWHPHVIVRSAGPKPAWPPRRSAQDLIAPEAAAAAGIHINMGDPIEVQLRPARNRLERNLHDEGIVALVRFLLVSRRYVFVHAAALTRNGRVVLISPRPDDGDAGFRLRRTSGYRSLNRDVAILSPGGPMLCYPNPVPIQVRDATLETHDAPSLERISLDIRTGTDRSQALSRLGRLLAGVRPPASRPLSTVLVMVPPLSPEDDAIPNAGAGSTSRIDHVFLFERGEPANRELTFDEGVAQLIDHTDLAYGFPPRSPLAADGYAELLQREGVLLWEALQGSSMRKVLVPGRGEADILPRLVQAPLPTPSDAAAHTAALTPSAHAWGPIVAVPSTDATTPAEPANGNAPTARREAAGSRRSTPPRPASRSREQIATKPSKGDKKAPRAASSGTTASSSRKTSKAAAAIGSKAPRSSRSRQAPAATTAPDRAIEEHPSVGRRDAPPPPEGLHLVTAPTALMAATPVTTVPQPATSAAVRRTRVRIRLPAARWPRWAVAPFSGLQAWRAANVRTVPAVAVLTMLMLMPTLASSDSPGASSVESGVEAASGGSRGEPLHVQDAFDGLREGSPVAGWAVMGGTPAETAVTAFPNGGDRSLRVQLAQAGRAVTLCKMGRFVEPVAVSLDFLIRGGGASDRVAIELPSGSRTLVEASATLGRGLALRAGSATYSVDRAIEPEVWYRSTLTFDSSTWTVSWMIDDRASRTPILRTPPVPLGMDLGLADGICLSVRSARVTDLFFLDNVRV